MKLMYTHRLHTKCTHTHITHKMYTHTYYTQNIARGKKERKKTFKSTCLQNTNVRYVATEASEVLVASTSSAQSGFPYIMCFAKFSSKELLQTTRLLSIPVLNFRFFITTFFLSFSSGLAEITLNFTKNSHNHWKLTSLCIYSLQI